MHGALAEGKDAGAAARWNGNWHHVDFFSEPQQRRPEQQWKQVETTFMTAVAELPQTNCQQKICL